MNSVKVKSCVLLAGVSGMIEVGTCQGHWKSAERVSTVNEVNYF